MAWARRADIHLELISQKRRNQLEIAPLKNLFLLAVLKLDVKDSFEYYKEIQIMRKTFSTI